MTKAKHLKIHWLGYDLDVKLSVTEKGYNKTLTTGPTNTAFQVKREHVLFYTKPLLYLKQRPQFNHLQVNSNVKIMPLVHSECFRTPYLQDRCMCR